jgi:hypothetical protein
LLAGFFGGLGHGLVFESEGSMRNGSINFVFQKEKISLCRKRRYARLRLAAIATDGAQIVVRGGGERPFAQGARRSGNIVLRGD